MDKEDVVFGLLKREPRLSMNQLLQWEDMPKPSYSFQEAKGKWLSETKDQFKAFKDPVKPRPVYPPALSEEPQSSTQIQPEEPRSPLKEPQKVKAILSSRSLSNTTFSNVYKKPVFANYGEGNTSIKSHKMFDKNHMKTFNVIPLKSSKNSVQLGAKMKTQTLKEQKKQKQETRENKTGAENSLQNPEVLQNGANEKTVVEAATQSLVLDEKLCKKCFEKYEPNCESLPGKNIRNKDPRTFKGEDPRKTLEIPYAGRPIKGSDRVYEVIFGDY